MIQLMKKRIFPVLLACMLLVAFTAHAAPACTLHFDYGQAALSLKAEEEFGIQISEEQYVRCSTVAGMTDLICELKGL